MNLLQTLRRMGQQVKSFKYAFATQDSQLVLINKLYARNGLSIKMTCGACPEQYEVFKGEQQVGYLRLRHGHFRVDYPNCGGETIYEGCPSGDGIFDDNERLIYMNRALREIIKKLNQ